MATDNVDEIIQCPACGKDMVKVYFPQQGVNLDICLNGCGGIYFDNRELEKFDESHEDITPLQKLFENKEFKKVDTSEKRICPVCGWTMVKHFGSAKKEIEIDECYGCGGKFLDYSELEKFRAQYNTEEERAKDVIKNLYDTAGIVLNLQDEEYEQRMKHKNLYANLVINKPINKLFKQDKYNF